MSRALCRVRRASALLVCAGAVAACDQPPDPATLPDEPLLLEAPVTGTAGKTVEIDLPGDAHYILPDTYVSRPNSTTVSDVANIAADPHSGIVAVDCLKEGSAWVRVFTSEGIWRIYPLTCERPALSGSLSAIVGEKKGFEMPGGAVQTSYLTLPYSETLSPIATVSKEANIVFVLCGSAGEAWLKVFTGNGFWKIYWLTCRPRHDQGGGS